MTRLIPAAWMQPVKMIGIVGHWSAGGHAVSAVDKEHYHIIVSGAGAVVKGDHDISDNVSTGDDDYAAHTRGANTGRIGLSMACMLNAIENPFDAGKFSMTEPQFNAFVQCAAELCAFYRIPVTDKTVLSHAEVQHNLGIVQAGKWDFSRLPFAPEFKGAKACGDHWRSLVAAAMTKL